MPSKTSAIRTALQSIDDEINGIVHAFDEEEKFLEIFSVKEEEITEKSVAKVETIKTALKGTFEDFEIAEVVADRDNLRETLEKLVEKQRELAVEKMDLLKKEAESDSLAHQLEVRYQGLGASFLGSLLMLGPSCFHGGRKRGGELKVTIVQCTFFIPTVAIRSH